jgi:hypothetical protein
MTDRSRPDISPDERPARTKHIDQKIPGAVTGLKASLHCHVDYIGDGPGQRIVTGIRFSERKKDGSSLERVLTALGDTLTAIFREEINAPEPTEPEGLHIVTADRPHIVEGGAG